MILKLKQEFVNIGIVNRNQGTITNLKGEFQLTVPKKFERDSITISHINYHPVKLVVKNFKNKPISLQPKTTQLIEVVVSNKKTKTRKRGVKSHSKLLSMRVASKDNDVIEVAQRINIPEKEVQVKSVNFNILKYSKVEGVKVRINFYENVDNAPGKRIIAKNIVLSIPIQSKLGWIHIDLNENDIYIAQDFFVAIEFIPNFKTSTVIDLGAILTKGRGYSRTSSLGTWNKLNGGASINVEIAH